MAPPPCADYTVADLIEHVDMVSRGFTAITRRDTEDATPSGHVTAFLPNAPIPDLWGPPATVATNAKSQPSLAATRIGATTPSRPHSGPRIGPRSPRPQTPPTALSAAERRIGKWRQAQASNPATAGCGSPLYRNDGTFTTLALLGRPFIASRWRTTHRDQKLTVSSSRGREEARAMTEWESSGLPHRWRHQRWGAAAEALPIVASGTQSRSSRAWPLGPRTAGPGQCEEDLVVIRADRT